MFPTKGQKETEGPHSLGSPLSAGGWALASHSLSDSTRLTTC